MFPDLNNISLFYCRSLKCPFWFFYCCQLFRCPFSALLSPCHLFKFPFSYSPAVSPVGNLGLDQFGLREAAFLRALATSLKLLSCSQLLGSTTQSDRLCCRRRRGGDDVCAGMMSRAGMFSIEVLCNDDGELGQLQWCYDGGDTMRARLLSSCKTSPVPDVAPARAPRRSSQQQWEDGD